MTERALQDKIDQANNDLIFLAEQCREFVLLPEPRRKLAAREESVRGAINAMLAAYRAQSARIAALEAERGKPWNDREDEWSAAIEAAHPTKTQRFDLDDKARQMVSARHSKGALVALVNWLLAQLATLTAERDAAREALRPFAKAADEWAEMGDTRPVDNDGLVLVSDLRRARAALAKEGKTDG
jgi:hypothetical protein